MSFTFGPRRASYVDITEVMPAGGPLTPAELAHFETFDLLYRSLCALLFNYVPTSGHPGGSISSGRFVDAILFDALDYDLGDPDRPDADLITYAAGHKAMGLYAMWALRDEVGGGGRPGLLPASLKQRLRLEDLLGFRRNPITATPLFREFGAKALDGHPTPATPFVRLSTGASGVGVASSIGLAIGARDCYGADAPRVHIVEGEGGLTPGRVAEALAAAGTASLANVVLHLDWNQASIDSDRVCREGALPGDYVQWDPRELFYLHDWNVIFVPDGHDVQQVVAAQRQALTLDTGQPTAIVYRTLKGWKYGVEGKGSHGAGHKLCSDGFYEALAELSRTTGAEVDLPTCDPATRAAPARTARACARTASGRRSRSSARGCTSSCRWRRRWRAAAGRARAPRRARAGPRPGAPRVDAAYELARGGADRAGAGGDAGRAAPRAGLVHDAARRARPRAPAPADGQRRRLPHRLRRPARLDQREHHRRRLPRRLLERAHEPGGAPALRRRHLRGRHRRRPQRHLDLRARHRRRLVLRRLHGAARPHRRAPARHRRPGAGPSTGEPYKPLILVCAHAGLKTGEDGPTHADPQALQLLQEDFPRGTAISLTPWEPQEIWTLTAAALAKRPAVISAFVTRPNEPVLDRDGPRAGAGRGGGLRRLRAARAARRRT